MRRVRIVGVVLLLFAGCDDPGLSAIVDLAEPRLQSPGDGACVVATTNPILAWSAATGARSYAVEVSTDHDMGVVVRRASELQSASITFGEPFGIGEYWWQVTASDGRGNQAQSAVSRFVMAAGMPPLQPVMSEELGCGQAPVVSWSDPFASEPGISYQLEVARHDVGGAHQVVLDAQGLTELEYEVPAGSLVKGDTYLLRVRREYLECPGPWADSGRFTMLDELPAPEDAVAHFEGCGPFEATLSWSHGGLPEGGIFQLQVDAGCGNIQLLQTTESRLSLDFDSGAHVWWRVRSVVDDGLGSSCASPWTEGERFTMVSGPAPVEGLTSGWEGCGPFDAALAWESPADLPQGAWFEVELEGELGFARVIETADALVELSLPAADSYSWRVRINPGEEAEPPCPSAWAQGPPLRTGWGRSWSRLVENAAFDARESHAVVGSEDASALFVIAGNASGDVSDVWRSTDGTAWEALTEDAGFSPRRWFGSTWFDDRLWVAAGIQGTGGSNRNDVWFSYDGAAWTEAQPHGATHFEARHAPSLLAHEGKLWIIAGEGPNCYTRADVWSSADGYSWERVTTSAGFPSRDWHGAVVFKDRMWVIGGITRSSACSETYLSDVWSSADGVDWRQDASGVFPARGGHAVVVFDEKIWVIGGTSAWPAATQSDVWYSSDGASWCRATDRHEFSNRYGLTAGVLDDRLLVIGGYDGRLRGDVWISD